MPLKQTSMIQYKSVTFCSLVSMLFNATHGITLLIVVQNGVNKPETHQQMHLSVSELSAIVVDIICSLFS